MKALVFAFLVVSSVTTAQSPADAGSPLRSRPSVSKADARAAVLGWLRGFDEGSPMQLAAFSQLPATVKAYAGNSKCHAPVDVTDAAQLAALSECTRKAGMGDLTGYASAVAGSTVRSFGPDEAGARTKREMGVDAWRTTPGSVLVFVQWPGAAITLEVISTAGGARVRNVDFVWGQKSGD